MVRERLRRLRPEKVEQLAAPIAEEGLLQPVSVRRDGQSYILVFGAHRLEAARRLGWSEIPAHVEDLDALTARLREIDENLARADLTALEEAQHLAERTRVWEALYRETTRDGVRKGQKITEIRKRQSLPFSN